MTARLTFYQFRRRTAQALLGIVAFAVFAFGAVDIEAQAATAVAVLGLLAVWALKKAADGFEVVSTPLYFPLGLVAAVAIVQVASGATAAPYATSGALLSWLVYLAFFFLAANTLCDASIRNRFYQGLLWIVSLAAGLGIGQWLTSSGTVYWFRPVPGGEPFGPFANGEHFAALIVLAFPVALMQALRRRSRKHYFFAACAVMIAALAFLDSAAGLIIVAVQLVALAAMVSGLTFASALRSRRRGPNFVWGVLGAIGLGMALLAASWSTGLLRIGAADLESVEAVLERSDGLLTRAEVLETSWRLIEQKPILGHGMGAFRQVFGRMAPRQDGRLWAHAECDPVELGVDAGFLGLAAQGLLLILLLLRARSLNVWGLVIAPLAGAWAHSWFSAPMQTPAVMLVGLALLGCTPGLIERVAVRREKAAAAVAQESSDEQKPVSKRTRRKRQ